MSIFKILHNLYRLNIVVLISPLSILPNWFLGILESKDNISCVRLSSNLRFLIFSPRVFIISFSSFSNTE